MNFAFTEEQEELRNIVRSFMEDKSPETAVRDLMETSVKLVRDEEAVKLRPRAREDAEERLLDLLLPPRATSCSNSYSPKYCTWGCPLVFFESFAEEELAVAYGDEKLEIGFNAKYLLEIASQVDRENAVSLFNSAGDPTLMREGNDTSAVYVVMPMRV